jgi:hypothetical protein
MQLVFQDGFYVCHYGRLVISICGACPVCSSDMPNFDALNTPTQFYGYIAKRPELVMVIDHSNGIGKSDPRKFFQDRLPLDHTPFTARY